MLDPPLAQCSYVLHDLVINTHSRANENILKISRLLDGDDVRLFLVNVPQ